MFVKLKINKINKILISYSQIMLEVKKTKTKTNLHWKGVLPICLVLVSELTPLWRHTASVLWNRAGRDSVVSRRRFLFLVDT